MASGSNATPTASFSDADDLTLKRYGRYIMQDAVGMIAETALCSAWRKGLRSRGSKVMFCVVIYLYASSVAIWATDFAPALEDLHSFLMIPGIPLGDRAALANQIHARLDPPGRALFTFNMIVGDSVVIWRVWAIYRQRIQAIVIPCFMLLTSFVFGMVAFACQVDSLLGAEERVCSTVAPISWAFSAATNITCTVMIGLKAWKHRTMMRQLNILGNLDPREMSTVKILSILVESGSIYCLLWISLVMGYFDITPDSPWFYVEKLVASFTNQMTGMFPTLIIVIVNFERTIWGDSPTKSNGATLNTLQFASAPGPTDSLGTHRGDIQLETVAEVTRQKSQVKNPTAPCI
ncbi:hypothetical protein DFH06DRAFT_1371592 [Mycena polygramma]|nr:hypothetical protein DFH06DRAFT_1371592 [Mycena polygramma]